MSSVIMEHNNFIILSICLLNITLALSFSTENYGNSKVNAVSKNTLDIKTTFKVDNKNAIMEIYRQKSAYKRVKRDGQGKFAEAAKAPQIKVLQQWLQMVRNTWSDDPIGGVHPLDARTPYGVVYLFKTAILDFLLPDVGKTYEE